MTVWYCPIPGKTVFILRYSQMFSKPSKQVWYNGGAILVHDADAARTNQVIPNPLREEWSTTSTVTNSVQNIFTRLRYCNKWLQPLTNTWYNPMVFFIVENLTTFNLTSEFSARPA